jgi:hypothetical protein
MSTETLGQARGLGRGLKFFAALFAIMNPPGNIPVFLSVTEGRSDRERAHRSGGQRSGWPRSSAPAC